MRITQVSQDFRGATLEVDAPIGASTLVVDTTVDFSDVGAGQLVIANDTTPLVYTGVDEDTATITLAAPLAEAVEAGTGVRLWDPDTGATTVEFKAGVVDEDGASFTAVLPHTLIPLSGLGALIGASCAVDEDLRVVEVFGREGVIDGAMIDPTTIPDPTVPTEPPDASPELTAAGTPRSIIVQAENVDVGVVIDYHLSTTAGFTPDASTLVRTTAMTIIEITTPLPDGSALDPAATYYLKAIAHNIVGAAPVGPEIAAQLKLDDSDTIAELTVSKLVGGTLSGATILAGMIAIGLITIDPDSGIVVPGAITIPADGSPLSIIAHAVLKSLTSQDNANFYGTSYLNGKFRVANGVTSPTVGPTPGRTWPSVTTGLADDTIVPPTLVHGLVERIDDPNYWVTVRNFYARGNYRAVHKTTGAVAPLFFGDLPNNFQPFGGITRIGTSYYVLGTDADRDEDWYVYRFDSTFTKTSEWRWRTNASGVVARTPAIGTDGTQILIAFTTAGSRLLVEEHSTGGTTNRVNQCFDFGVVDTHCSGVYMGNADYGSDTLIVATPTRVYAFNPATWVNDTTSLTRVTTREWKPANAATILGLNWDGTRFRSLDSTGRVWDYSRQVTTTLVNVAHAWYDGNPDGGEHRTMTSPHAPWSWAARSWLTATTPPPPDVDNTDPLQTDKADRVLVYAGVGAVRLQQALAVGVTTMTPLDVLDTGSAAPAPSNEFASANAAAGQIESTASDTNGPLWALKGDGTITLPVEVGTASGAAPFAGTLTLEKVGRTVVCSGNLSRASGSSTSFTTAATIPAGFRPAAVQLLPGAAFFNTALSWQANVATDGDLTIRMSGANSGAMAINATWVTP